MKLNPRATNKPKTDFLFEMEKEFFILQSLDDSAATNPRTPYSAPKKQRNPPFPQMQKLTHPEIGD